MCLFCIIIENYIWIVSHHKMRLILFHIQTLRKPMSVYVSACTRNNVVTWNWSPIKIAKCTCRRLRYGSDIISTFAHFFLLLPIAWTMPGLIRAIWNYQKKEMLSLTRVCVCRTYPVLGITHSGFLYQSICYRLTKNQL